MAIALPAAIDELLACPACKSDFEFDGNWITCAKCDARFAQSSSGWLDLFLSDRSVSDTGDWCERQKEMVRWYEEVVAEPWVCDCLRSDYAPFASDLRKFSGLVLDIGGGAGVARASLPHDAQYVLLEPSESWTTDAWLRVAQEFAGQAALLGRIRGVAEHLPFRAAQFDAVLMFWTLNHVSRPDLAMYEASRVLKPDGELLMVLEDMEPTWWDLAWGWRCGMRCRHVVCFARSKISCLVARRRWTIAPDHVRIEERDLQQWANPSLALVRRAWIGRYLSVLFRKM